MRENYKLAIQKGEEIAQKYNQETTIPFPFDEIIKREPGLLGIYEFSSDEEDHNFLKGSEGILGLIVYRGDEKFKIFVNDSKKILPARKYFTIAHELGHFFLHQNLVKEKSLVIDGDFFIYREDNGIPQKMETEANQFATALLMPEKRVRLLWEALKDVDRCAEFFKVSRTAMSIRLDTLDLN